MAYRHGTIGALLIAAVSACNSAPPPTARTFSRLIVFGDSLSDTGNIRNESLIVPAPPYSEGRFTNGETWTQLLAAHFGIEARPSYFFGGTNYAQGGAGTDIGLTIPEFAGIPLGPNIREQLNFYDGRPDGTELFAVWGGANDIFQNLLGACAIPAEQIAENIFLAIAELYQRGGRNFIVPNLPDIGKAPRYRNSPQQQQASDLSAAVRNHLAPLLGTLDQLDGIKVYRLDANAIFDNAIANPPPPVTNVTEAAWSGSFLGYLGGGTLAANPDEYLFWDGVHPTRISHRVIAENAIAVIENEFMQPTSSETPIRPQPPSLPGGLGFWADWLPLAVQPSGNSEQCRY
jgi:phospholipase/lecithinase/hemolysin